MNIDHSEVIRATLSRALPYITWTALREAVADFLVTGEWKDPCESRFPGKWLDFSHESFEDNVRLAIHNYFSLSAILANPVYSSRPPEQAYEVFLSSCQTVERMSHVCR